MKKLFKKALVCLITISLVIGQGSRVSVFAKDGVSNLLTVEGTNIYANGHNVRLEAANEDESFTYIYVNDIKVVDAIIIGDSNGSDGYDLSTVTLFGGSKDVISSTSSSIIVNGGTIFAIYAGGSAMLSIDLEEKLQEIDNILSNTTNSLLEDLMDLDEANQALVATLITSIEQLVAVFEKDLLELEGNVIDILLLAQKLVTDIEDLMKDYILPESELYIGQAGTIIIFNLQEALEAFLYDLQKDIEESLTNVVGKTILDTLMIIFGSEDLDEKDLEDLLAVADLISKISQDSADLETVKAEITALGQAPSKEDFLTTPIPEKPIMPSNSYTQAYQNAVEELKNDGTINEIMLKSYTYTIGSGFFSYTKTVQLRQENIDFDELYKLLGDTNISSITSIYSLEGLSLDEITTSVWLLPMKLTEISAAIAANISDETYLSDEEYQAALARYELDKAAYDKAVAENEEELLAYEDALATYKTKLKELELQSSTLSSAITSNTLSLSTKIISLSSVLGLDISNVNIFEILSGDTSSLDEVLNQLSKTIEWVEFIYSMQDSITTLITNISTDPTGAIETFLAEISELEMTDTIKKDMGLIIYAVLENIEEELVDLGKDTLTSLEEKLYATITDSMEEIESVIGTPEEFIENIIKEALKRLDLESTNKELQEILTDMLATMDTKDIEAIITEVMIEVNKYLENTGSTIEGLVETIIRALYEELLEVVFEILEAEVGYIKETNIQVTGGYVESIYARGLQEGTYIESVNISLLEGTYGEVYGEELDFIGSNYDAGVLGFNPSITKILQKVLDKTYIDINTVNLEITYLAPEILGATNQEIAYGAKFDALEGVSATDTEDGDLTASIVVEGDVDTSVAGDYTVTYSVTDSRGLTTSLSITVTVLEEVIVNPDVEVEPEVEVDPEVEVEPEEDVVPNVDTSDTNIITIWVALSLTSLILAVALIVLDNKKKSI